MPLATDDNAPTKFPDPQTMTLANFKRGVITLIDQSRLPKNALKEAKNIMLVEDGQPAVRWGTDWFGTAMPNGAAIDGFDYFDFNGVIHVVAAAGGNVYRSTDDAKTWTLCSGGTLTAGLTVGMNQNFGFLYLTTGTDNMLRYNGTTTLQAYTTLSTPSAPTVADTGLTGTSYTYYYKIAAVNEVGFSIASSTTSHTFSLPRGAWTSTAFATLTMPAYVATQTRYDIYFSEDNVNFYYLDSVVNPNLSYRDDGTAIPIPSTIAPTANTTQGPKVQELKNVGVRQFGVRDTQNRYRIWWTGSGTYAGAFSYAYDGGYLDWQPGGKYYPVHVEDYRDGKGTPLATIWMDSADGQGCIVQLSLDTLTIDNISITLPSAYQLPGSRGTNAPGSVCNILNDYMFYNLQAFYNLGSRAKFLNLLSTDEASGNIRPTMHQITTAASGNIASAYFDANVFMSVPMDGSLVNNQTIVYNTEQQAWLPEAFTIGFSKFLRYTTTATDGSKKNRLLALKPGDNRLSEVSKDIKGDYGNAFETSLTTGLYPLTGDRFRFMTVDDMQYEFSNPNSDIWIELLGYHRSGGFKQAKLAKLNVNSAVVDTGWDSHAWDTQVNDNTGITPAVYSESSVKRYTPVGKELNNAQFHIYTNTLDANYVLRTLQTIGTDTDGGMPSQWRVAAT